MRSNRALVWVAGVIGCGLASGFGCGLDAVGSAVGATDPDALAPDASSSDAPASDDGPDGAALDAPVEAECGDVQSAPSNCGRCGHSCLGGTCAAGKCQPVSLVTGDPGLGAVVVDATTAYYVAENSGVIRKIPIAGGASVDLFATGRAPHDLAFDGDRIFWTDQFGGGAAFLAGTSVKFSGGNGSARAVATTTQGPYFITATSVDMWNRGLTAVIQSFTNNSSSPAIVTDATYAYWSAGQQIRRVLHTSSSVTNVVTGIGANPTSMAISATHVYWTTATKVQRAPIGASAGWTIETLVSTEIQAASIAVDGTHAYWMDLTTGALRRAPLAGGGAETLATFSAQLTDAAYPHQIALTPDAICIASTSDGTLSRLAK